MLRPVTIWFREGGARKNTFESRRILKDGTSGEDACGKKNRIMYEEYRQEQMIPAVRTAAADEQRSRLVRWTAAWMLGIIVFLTIFAAKDVRAAYKESDYKLVYNYEYYINKYPYLKKKFKTRAAVLKRFVEYGMNHGARGSLNFNPKRYRANYPDLQKKYGYNWKQYYLHYMRTGKAEGRLARADVKTYKFKLAINPNGGKYKGSTKIQTRYRKYGTKLTMPKPTRAGYVFAGWKLIGTGKLNGNVFVFTRTRLGTTTLKATWKKATTDAKVENMVRFALSKVGMGGSEVWRYWGFEEEWCCMFVTYCADKGGGLIGSGVQEDQWGNGRLPKCAGQRELAYLLKARGQLHFSSSGYMPKRGDLIFFSRSGRTTNVYNFSHIGIVTGCDGKYVYTVEGNTGTYDRHTSYVKEKSYELTAERVAAYGEIK